MKRQVIRHPACCPTCAGQLCATGVSSETITIHCHNCGWSKAYETDPEADDLVIVAGEDAEDPRGR